MEQYINKNAIMAEINRNFERFLSFLDALEVIDPYEQCVQYPSVEDGIKAHAETYSFNIESELFPQLTKEQQALWRKEIEQACISGGDAGVELARDIRYKENLEVKEEVSNDAFIGKACEWLKSNLYDYAGEDDKRNIVPFDSSIFEDFKKAMKGGER